MEKKTMIAALALAMLLFISSNELTRVDSQGVNCLDSCTTGCVIADDRLRQRCERKCEIRCSSGPSAADAHLN